MSAPTLRDVLSVMDRLDAPPMAVDVDTARKALVARVTEISDANPQQVTVAVAAHLQETATPSGPATHRATAGSAILAWWRPSTLAHHQRWAHPQGWRKVVHRLVMNDLFSAALWAAATVSVPIVALAGGGLSLLEVLSCLLGSVVGAGSLAYLGQTWFQQIQEVFPSPIRLNQWAGRADTRAYIQRCLDSACPILMQGDLKHLARMVARHQAAALVAAQQRADEAEVARQDTQRSLVRQQFQQAMDGQDGRAA